MGVWAGTAGGERSGHVREWVGTLTGASSMRAHLRHTEEHGPRLFAGLHVRLPALHREPVTALVSRCGAVGSVRPQRSWHRSRSIVPARKRCACGVHVGHGVSAGGQAGGRLMQKEARAADPLATLVAADCHWRDHSHRCTTAPTAAVTRPAVTRQARCLCAAIVACVRVRVLTSHQTTRHFARCATHHGRPSRRSSTRRPLALAALPPCGKDARTLAHGRHPLLWTLITSTRIIAATIMIMIMTIVMNNMLRPLRLCGSAPYLCSMEPTMQHARRSVVCGIQRAAQ